MACQVRFPKEGNPYYPLPVHYPELSSADQKRARLNAVRLQETPEDLVRAWSFFRTYYLRQTPVGFFYKRFRESPPFHYQMVRDIGANKFNAVGAPRGSAKSTVLAVEVPLLLSLTRNYFNILLVLSKETMVVKRMSTQIGHQLRNNPYILEDFGKQRLGSSTWSAHLMHLANDSIIEAVSAKGGTLGARPDLILVDDVEFDPVLNKISPELTENFSRYLSNHLQPMLDEEVDGGGTSLYWIGTLLSKQCFLYYVVMTKTDSRFVGLWNRRLLDAEDNGKGQLLWPEKWDRKTLEAEKISLGLAAYNSQRRNRPGEGDEATFDLHAELNSYEVDERDANWKNDPLTSDATFRTWKDTGAHKDGSPAVQVVTRPFGPAVAGMRRIMTMDYAKCLSPTSDYIAFHVMGIENSKDFRNTWWSLDLRMGRWPGSKWVPLFWEMALRWRVQWAGIEAVAAQETLVQTAEDYADRVGMVGWVPRVVPIKYPYGLSKEDRIGSLEGRVRKRRLRFPRDLRHIGRDPTTGPYRELYAELEAFSGLPGASQYDDAEDAVAMVQFLVKSSGKVDEPDTGLNSQYNIYECLERGEPVVDGIQVGLGADLQNMPVSTLNVMLARHYDQQEDEELDRKERQRSSWIGRKSG